MDPVIEYGVRSKVLPLTREWIEIPLYLKNAALFEVLPLTREWIEICMPRSQY